MRTRRDPGRARVGALPDHHCVGTENHVPPHDLRFVIDGEVTQIDHYPAWRQRVPAGPRTMPANSGDNDRGSSRPSIMFLALHHPPSKACVMKGAAHTARAPLTLWVAPRST
jgi:hypothetical protein